jgi:protein-tyrosine phosphatase
MIDTHCHLLPGIDDGPRTVREALQLAQMMVADGISSVLCTPHYSRLFPTHHAAALESHEVLRSGLTAAGIALETAVAAEVSPGYAVSAPIEEIELRSVGDRFVVVEVLPDSAVVLFPTVVERLASRGLVPVFAHPERSRAVHRDLSAVDDARLAGALIQVLAPSVLGRWGADVASAALDLLDTGLVDLLASDAHGAKRRRVHLAEAAELVERRLGSTVVRELTEHAPRRVLAGAEVH